MIDWRSLSSVGAIRLLSVDHAFLVFFDGFRGNFDY